jgi:acyl dehydratase
MRSFPSLPRGLWFEEFQPGQRLVTAGRTVTEADIVTFAGLSGDHNVIHTNAVFAESTGYGKRPAHGLLVVSIISGLLVQTGLLDGTLGAFREILTWKFKKPVFIGDTIRAEMKILKTRLLRGMESGLVRLGLRVINQDDVLVMSGKLEMLVLGMPKELKESVENG